MNEMRYNIVYFHGLGSSLSAEKMAVLEEFGQVINQTYEYEDPKVLNSIVPSFVKPDAPAVVIGSSMGGYFAKLFSLKFDIPCLLFNPAFVSRSLDLATPAPLDTDINSSSYIVLGKQDERINYSTNQTFISRTLKGPVKVIVDENLAHQIPRDDFAKHVSLFFESLKETIPRE